MVKTVINGMVFDGATKDPIQQAVRDALIAFMAATAPAQAEATKAAQQAGIEAAKAKAAYLGRKPSYSRATFETVKDMLASGAGASAIARATNFTRQTILRINADPVSAEKALAVWGL